MEENKYEEIIARYSFEQLVYEQAILDKEDTILYNKKKALKNEFKKRLEEKWMDYLDLMDEKLTGDYFENYFIESKKREEM